MVTNVNTTAQIPMLPAQATVVDKNQNLTQAWSMFLINLVAVLTKLNSSAQAGPTTARPTLNLFVGMTYYDTTIGAPIVIVSLAPTVWNKYTLTGPV